MNTIEIADKAYKCLTENDNTRVCDVEDALTLLMIRVCEEIDEMTPEHCTCPSLDAIDKLLFSSKNVENSFLRICARYNMYLSKAKELAKREEEKK